MPTNFVQSSFPFVYLIFFGGCKRQRMYHTPRRMYHTQHRILHTFTISSTWKKDSHFEWVLFSPPWSSFWRALRVATRFQPDHLTWQTLSGIEYSKEGTWLFRGPSQREYELEPSIWSESTDVQSFPEGLRDTRSCKF